MIAEERTKDQPEERQKGRAWEDEIQSTHNSREQVSLSLTSHSLTPYMYKTFTLTLPLPR